MDYFDVSELAKFLHVLPKQVQRWAERGHVPAQRVNGEWRFSRAAVHQWIEDKLHDLDGQQEMTDVVKHHLVCIADLLPEEGIALPLGGKTTTAVIDELAKTASQTGMLWDAQMMADAVREREKMASTAFECGVALMHPRHPMVKILQEPFIALGITPRPISVGTSGSGQSCQVDIFFLLCSTEDTMHLRTLARLGRLIAQPDFLDNLRAAQSSGEILEVIRQAETLI